MKFRINAIKDGKPTYYTFDNETLDITNSLGIPAYLDEDIRFSNFHPIARRAKYTVFSQNPKSIVGKDHIRKIKVSLGFKCNYKCKYCWQHQLEHSCIDATPALVSSFMSKLRQLDLSKCNRIDLWGGEPLVYWKTIRHLIPSIKEEYPSADIAVQSNGSLLTKEIADFMVKYNILYGISHDGPAFSVFRDKEDPLDTNLDAIKYYCNKTYEKHNRYPWFSLTLNKYNTNLDEIYPYFWSKLGKDTPFYVHIDSAIITATEHDYKLFSFTEEEKQRFYKNALKVYLDINHPLHNDFEKDLKNVVFHLVNKITPYEEDACDMTNPHVIAVNLKGDVISCHSNPDQVVGNLSDISKVDLNTFTHWSNHEYCKACPILPICRGGRPCIDSANHHWICSNLILWRYPMLLAAWKVLFDAEITSIEKEN